MRIKNKVVLITGAAGFIGSHLADEIVIRQPEKLVLIDNLFLGRMGNIESLLNDGTAEFHYADVTQEAEMDRIIRTNSIDVVFNLAVVPLPTSLVRPSWTVDQNVAMCTVLCKLLYEGAFETLILCSSSEAYGTSEYEPMDEKHPLNPTTPYAASKAASDLVALSYWRTFGLDITVPRPFNCYGPRQNDRRFAGVIPTTINRIIQGLSPVIFGDGSQKRDYLYVSDTAKAIANFYEHHSTRGEVVNIASSVNISVTEIIEKLKSLMKSKTPIEYRQRRLGDVESHLGDNTLVKKLIGFKPETTLDDGFIQTIEYYTNQKG